MAVAGVVSRTTGKAVAKKVEKTDTPTLAHFLTSHVEPQEILYTDEARAYTPLGSIYQQEAVNHSAGEYVRGHAHTNGVESFWALLKRGYMDVFHDITWKQGRKVRIKAKSAHFHHLCKIYRVVYQSFVQSCISPPYR